MLSYRGACLMRAVKLDIELAALEALSPTQLREK